MKYTLACVIEKPLCKQRVQTYVDLLVMIITVTLVLLFVSLGTRTLHALCLILKTIIILFPKEENTKMQRGRLKCLRSCE